MTITYFHLIVNISMDTEAKPIVLTGATAITPFRRHEDCSLVLENGKIAQMGHADDVDIPFGAEVIELEGRYVLPGFIDIHVHGGRGHDFCDDSPGVFDEISEFHAIHGTTSLIATVYPQPRDALVASIRRLRDYCERTGPRRIVEGIHLEGPFLNPLLHGAIRADYMWPATIENFRMLMEEGGSWIRVMTVAPEIPGGMEVLHEAAIHQRSPSWKATVAAALYLSVGHSNAKYEAVEAIDNGLEGVTHIFNAMPHASPQTGRPHGNLAARAVREVIADSVHASGHFAIADESQEATASCWSATPSAAGQPDGAYVFSDQECRSATAGVSGGFAGYLAGSTLTMDQAEDHGPTRRREYSTSGPDGEPQRRPGVGLEVRRGSWPWQDADLAILDENFHNRMTIKAGHVVWSADPVYR